MTNAYIKSELTAKGADIVGFGDLTVLPEDVRRGLPVGISVAVKYPKDIISGIEELPTPEYFEWYNKLNDKLHEIMVFGEEILTSHGFRAVALTKARVGNFENAASDYRSPLPQKTVATCAGIGWIGKCALLVTRQYGSMVRIGSILTDAPFKCAAPIEQSKCGSCKVCVNACPGKAASGKKWFAGLDRADFFDAHVCAETAKDRAERGFGTRYSVCGKCIVVCPYTRRYLSSG